VPIDIATTADGLPHIVGNDQMPQLSWEEKVYIAAGLWPVAVELPAGEVRFLLWYKTSDGSDRVLVKDSRTVALESFEEVGPLIRAKEFTGNVAEEGRNAMGILATLASPEMPHEQALPRCLVGQSLEWLSSVPSCFTPDQAYELLHTINFLRLWHQTLADLELVGEWPANLDRAAAVLEESVVIGEITPALAIRGAAALDAGTEIERVLGSLMELTESWLAEKVS
jgi:hypothetical protein